MPTTRIDGIATRYELSGSGPPLLMFSPGGFNATLDNWRGFGIYQRLDLLGQLGRHYTCIAFDRRESGGSGGRVERIGWRDYATQGIGLLDHLGIGRADLIGGCVGCSVALQAAVCFPERVGRLVLYSPAGGPRYRLAQLTRFARHLAYLEDHSLADVVELARSTDKGFTADPRLGPWCTVARTDPRFARDYQRWDPDRYRLVVSLVARTMFDRDTVPGPEPEELMLLTHPALIVPGQDASHAPSAARYLQECLSSAQYWDVPVSEQTPAEVGRRLDQFRTATQP